MKSLVSKYRDANVMVVGGEGSACKHAAHDYGFKNVVTPEEIHSVHPSVCPISTCEARAVPWTEVTIMIHSSEWQSLDGSAMPSICF
jgi:hypothetical protein